MSMLKQEYKEEELTIEDAKKLAIRVLSKTLDMTKITAEKGTVSSSACICHCFIPFVTMLWPFFETAITVYTGLG